jgi:hypothetical protein
VYVTFEDWTQDRTVASLGTNAGAAELPFQKWRHFKEAFAPEIVRRAIAESEIPVVRCVDPFGGSGTTALACQFLGVQPLTVEVNPFLADLIEAKLSQYDCDALARDLGTIAGDISRDESEVDGRFSHLPPTFLEPGVKGQWIFDRTVAARIASILSSIDRLAEEAHRRLFRVLLGGILVEVSNVVISGKGRRYRRNWQHRSRESQSVDEAFYDAVQKAIQEVHRFSRRRLPTFEVVRGDSRTALRGAGNWDLAVFSPPYPNSFDYTDVYNIELWVLGYLSNSESNRFLRQATLSSHVQISRNFSRAPCGSPLLDGVMAALDKARSSLWDRHIPEMVGAYFADLQKVLDDVQRGFNPGGACWMVVGDSQYGGVQIATAAIIAELAVRRGWAVGALEPFRSMRISPQQGGNAGLAETLVVLKV